MNLRRYSRDDIKGRRVLVRADLDVAQGDTLRLERALPGILELLEFGAEQVVIVGHRGRPKGRVLPEYSLAKISSRLAQLVGRDIHFVEDIETDPNTVAEEPLVMLENMRFWPGEEADDSVFAQTLARWGEVYVNDAFGVCHRAAASVSAVARLELPVFAGAALAGEVEHLERFMTDIKHPFVAVMGGAKIETKLPLLAKLAQQADAVLIGGVLANTVLASRGVDVGASLVETEQVDEARTLASEKIILPLDAVGRDGSTLELGQLGPEDYIGDIGPETLALFCEKLTGAGAVLWNGPMGKFEEALFRSGTEGIARAVSQSTGRTLIGGGDTIEAITSLSIRDSFGFVSAGGGAMLTFLSGGAMPGLEALVV